MNVSLSIDKKSEWTSIAGVADVVHDRAKAEELWAKPLEAWFPDGLETPGLTLIKVHASTAEYWEAPSSTVKQLLGMALGEGARAVVLEREGHDCAPRERRVATRAGPSASVQGAQASASWATARASGV